MSRQDDENQGGVAESTTSSGASQSLLRGMRDGRWLDAQEFEPLAWHVDGVLPEGMGLLCGPPKVGKSWLVAGVGLSVAAGGMTLGRIACKQRPVLYLALEDGDRRLQSRFRTIMEGPLPAEISYLTKVEQNLIIPTIAEYLSLHRNSAPLILLDTLGKARPPKQRGDDSYAADYALGTQLKNLTDGIRGACLLIVHHTRKAESADFVDSVSGTQGIAGSADFILILSRKRKSNEAVLSVTGRDIPENEYALVVEDGRWSLDGMDLLDAAATVDKRQQTGKLGDRSSDYLTFVQSRPLGTRPSDLAQQFQCSSNDASTYLQRLYSKGLIDKRGRGSYVPIGVSEVSDGTATTAAVSDIRGAGVSDTGAAVSDSNMTLDQGELRGSYTSDTSDTSFRNDAPPPPNNTPQKAVSEVSDRDSATARARIKALEILEDGEEWSPREMRRRTSKETRFAIGPALDALVLEGVVTHRVDENRKKLYRLANPEETAG